MGQNMHYKSYFHEVKAYFCPRRRKTLFQAIKSGMSCGFASPGRLSVLPAGEANSMLRPPLARPHLLSLGLSVLDHQAPPLRPSLHHVRRAHPPPLQGLAIGFQRAGLHRSAHYIHEPGLGSLVLLTTHVSHEEAPDSAATDGLDLYFIAPFAYYFQKRNRPEFRRHLQASRLWCHSFLCPLDSRTGPQVL